jgi:hypothetical protein
MPGCCQKTVVTMLLNHRVFEGLFDDRGATFDGLMRPAFSGQLFDG